MNIMNDNREPEASRTINLDASVMDLIQSRLPIGDFGRLSVQISRAAAAKRPSELQRLLLRIVRHREDDPAVEGAP